MRRPPTRTTVVAAAALLAAVAAGCAVPDKGSPSQEPAPSETPAETGSQEAAPGPPAKAVRLAELPGVAQPGEAAEEPPDGPLMVASVTPTRSGGEVVLQQRTDAGWETVSRAQQDVAGVARFTDTLVPDTVAGQLFRAAAVGADGDVEQVSNEVAGTSWTEVFSDGFDGSALDTSTWSYRSLGVYNREDDGLCSVSDESAVAVADGSLQLQVRRDPDRAGEACRTEHGTFDYYLNGRIDSHAQFNFTYGVAAARVRFQQGRGQHGAFWLQRTAVPVVPGDPEATGVEVDVAEFFGDGAKDGGMGAYVYYVNRRNESEKVGDVQPEATSQLPPGDTWWDRYHVFSVEWTPDGYVYRVDGREIYRTDRGVSGVDQYLVLSLSTKDWELPRLDPSLLPSTMEVDWVRVWQDAGS